MTVERYLAIDIVSSVLRRVYWANQNSKTVSQDKLRELIQSTWLEYHSEINSATLAIKDPSMDHIAPKTVDLIDSIDPNEHAEMQLLDLLVFRDDPTDFTEVLLSDYSELNLSEEAYLLFAKKLGLECYFYDWDLSRLGPFCKTTVAVTTNDESKLLEGYEQYMVLKDIKRNDPNLISTVRELKEKAFYDEEEIGNYRIALVPTGVNWYIDKDDNFYETVREVHSEWLGKSLMEIL